MPKTQPKKRVFIFSDTHIGKANSSFDKRREFFEEQIGAADIVIFGGDLVELGSNIPDIRATPVHLLNEAQKKKHLHKVSSRCWKGYSWLGDLIEQYPEKQFHFLHGNHERHWEPQKWLQALNGQYGNLQCHPEAMLLGDTLIVHGDLIFRKQRAHSYNHCHPSSEHDDEYRQRFHEYLIEIANARTNEDAAMSLDVACEDGHTRPLTLEMWAKVKKAVYGHTHRWHDGVEINGITYYNSGATVPYEGPNILFREARPFTGLTAEYDGERMTDIRPAPENRRAPSHSR